MYLKRLSTLIVFLMVVSSLVFWMRARHLTESIIPFYLVNCQTGESPNMLFKFCPTGTKISRCVYAGEGLILLFSVLLMGFVKAAFCRLTCLIYVDDLSVALNACRVGCCVGKVLINHLMYADDLVILAPSVSGLSKARHTPCDFCCLLDAETTKRRLLHGVCAPKTIVAR